MFIFTAVTRMNRLLMVWLLLQGIAAGFSQAEFSTCLFDRARDRVAPVTVYRPEKEGTGTRVVIFNHGYDGNRNSKSNQTYSCLTRFLADKGFYVISVQHELSRDPPLAMEGPFMETRLSNWEREWGISCLFFRSSGSLNRPWIGGGSC